MIMVTVWDICVISFCVDIGKESGLGTAFVTEVFENELSLDFQSCVYITAAIQQAGSPSYATLFIHPRQNW